MFTATDAAVGGKFPALGDLDGDGDGDIVRSNGKVYLNQGGGSFTETAYAYSCYQLTGHVAWATSGADDSTRGEVRRTIHVRRCHSER